VTGTPTRGTGSGLTPTQPSTRGLPPKATVLLDAVVALSTDLDLPSVLTRIIESASDLTGARYGALGVIGEDGNLVEFITTGLDQHTQKMIGDRPSGRGVLRLLIDEAEPLRLADLGAHPKSLGFPPHHPPMVTFLGVPIRIRGTVFGNLYLTEKQGGVRFTEQDEVLVQALAGAAGVVIENARAYGLSERRRQWLEEAAELTDALQPHIHLDAALMRITSGVQSVSKALGAAVIQFPEDDEPVISAPQGLAFEALEPLLPEIAALAAQSGSGGYPVDLTTSGLTAVLVPLRAHLTEAGMLVALFDRNLRPVGYEERELLAAFAEHAGLALDRVQAFADRERLAVVSERERIARDLHDVVIQRLFATGMKLRGLTSPSADESVAAGVEAALSDLDLTVKDIRSTIFALRSPQAAALRSQINSAGGFRWDWG
jgi:GAF domain-containing protein